MPLSRDQLRKLVISPDATLRQALLAIDEGARQIALVVGEDRRLLATVTDGDIRRGLLADKTLDAPVAEIMRTEFTALCQSGDLSAVRRIMQERSLHQVPIVDADGRLLELAHIDDITGVTRRETEVVLMAGGLGTRLRPLTETVPKPMVEIGGRPILEIIMRNFLEQGFHRFTLSLNYKGEMIRDHFGAGTAIGAKISYVAESRRMGTAGALSLLERRPDKPFVVMNGDLLTALRFSELLDFHDETGASATMVARNYAIQIPYGVIERDGTSLSRMIEKPTHNHLVNAGIYMLSPEVFDHIEPDEPLDMPTLFDRLIAVGRTASVYPIEDYWIDIGRMEDLERARTEIPALDS